MEARWPPTDRSLTPPIAPADRDALSPGGLTIQQAQGLTWRHGVRVCASQEPGLGIEDWQRYFEVNVMSGVRLARRRWSPHSDDLRVRRNHTSRYLRPALTQSLLPAVCITGDRLLRREWVTPWHRELVAIDTGMVGLISR
jgi:hypothetical protein